jgi:hypothetical protein
VAHIDRWLRYEDEHGFTRARLTLTRTEDGGRQTAIKSGYRSCWDISPAGDGSLFSDAPLLLEGGDQLALGESAAVRLHPLFPEYWEGVQPGQVLGMFEGSKRVGLAVVLDNELREST